MLRIHTASLLLIAALGLGGCGDDDSPADGASSADASVPNPFDAQVAEGSALFATHCARCHGDAGEGTSFAPPLVGIGEGALPLEPRPGSMRTTQFVTVGDIADFAATAMPADAPGSLETDEYFAILAFDLFANGITLDEELTPALAPTLTIPR